MMKSALKFLTIVASCLLSNLNIAEAAKIEFDSENSISSTHVEVTAFAGEYSSPDSWSDSDVLYDISLQADTLFSEASSRVISWVKTGADGAPSESDEENKVFEFYFYHTCQGIPGFLGQPPEGEMIFVPAGFSSTLDATGKLCWKILPSNEGEEIGMPVEVFGGRTDDVVVGSNSGNATYEMGVYKWEVSVAGTTLGTYENICTPSECHYTPDNPFIVSAVIGDTVSLSYEIGVNGQTDDSHTWSSLFNSHFGPSIKMGLELEVINVCFLDKENRSRRVVGAAADGASEVTIQINGLPPDLTDPRQIVIRVPEKSGELLNDAKIEDGVFTRTWRAPSDFGGGNPGEGRRRIDFQIGGEEDEAQLPVPEFYLYKPPLVLIHGLWSKKGDFRDMITYLLVNNFGLNGRLMHTDNYPNDAHFSENVEWIEDFVTSALRKAGRQREDKFIVVNKADIVAHSMGGILANLYVNSPTYKDNVNRIITIGTPHSGSELANFALHFLYDKDEAPQEIRKIILRVFEAVGRSLTNGAVEDLQVGSSAMIKYREGLRMGIPTYSLVGAHADVTPDWERSELGGLYRLLYALDYACNIEDTYFKDADSPDYIRLYDPLKVEEGLFGSRYSSDFVVSSTSQTGGARRVELVNVKDHMNETNNDDVIQMVLSALNSPMENFDQDGFSPPIDYPVPTVGVCCTSETTAESLVGKVSSEATGTGFAVTSPTKGDIFRPGDNIIVKVSYDGSPNQVYFLSQDLSVGFDDSFPYEFEFTVNNEFLGPMLIGAWLIMEDGSIETDLVEVNIATDEIPEQIDTLSLGPLYLRVGDKVILSVDAVYQGNVVREITSLSATHYTSSNPDVVEVSSDGLITAKSEGEAVVTVENSGVSEQINITVMPIVSFVDYAILADRWRSQNCTEPDWCDGADLDNSGEIDFVDLRIFAETWLEEVAL